MPNEEIWKIQRMMVLAIQALLPVLLLLPQIRSLVQRWPRRVLALLLVVDFSYFVWIQYPFVPLGLDESQLRIHAALYLGQSGLPLTYIRTPVPGYAAGLFPFFPPLLGICAREISAFLAFILAKRFLPESKALLAAWVTLLTATLANHSAFLLSEPYGAAALAGFALVFCNLVDGKNMVAHRGNTKGWHPLGKVALLGFSCAMALLTRWQLGMLLPFAAFGAFYAARLKGLMLLSVMVPILMWPVLLSSGADPIRVVREHSSVSAIRTFECLMFYLHPKNGYGVGLLGLLLAAIGTASALNRGGGFAFGLVAIVLAYMMGITKVGVDDIRFAAPLVPLLAVLVCLGCWTFYSWLQEKASPRGSMILRVIGLPLLGLLLAIPLHAPKIRAEKRGSVEAELVFARAAIMSLVVGKKLYSDYNHVSTTAALLYPVHAVTGDGTRQPFAMDLSWDGQLPSRTREELERGVYYLTYKPAGRHVLWQARGLSLVQW